MKIKGKGSITALDGKPKYRCRKWRLFVSTDCGRQTRVVEGTFTEACKALEAFKAELSDKVPVKETFAAYAALWLVWRDNSGQYAPGTITNNARDIKALCRSKLATLRIDEITPRDCREALLWVKMNPKRGNELSNTTMNKICITLSAIFRQAEDDGIIPSSPMRNISPPRPDTEEKRALTPDELRAFVDDLDGITLDGRTMALYLMALLGLRRSEACAIGHDDFRDGFAHVHLAIKERNGAIGKPKSIAGIRSIPCPDRLTQKLEEWQAVCAHDSVTVCCNTRGGILRPQLLQRWWSGDAKHIGVRESLGYPDLTLHQLRHSNLSMMARHMSPFDLQRYAGWSSIEPARVYVHEDLSEMQRAVNGVRW